jgi:hypothetical protein
MRRLLTTMALLGIGVACASHATAQGPVREGLRRTGEIAAEGTQRVIQGTGRVIEGTAQATRDVGEATLNAAGATARGVRQGVDAVTPGLPLQARADANLSAAEQRRDARWRFAHHNGERWYYSPENRWMYHRNGDWNEFAEDRFQPLPQQGQRYAMGYRGIDPAVQGDQPTQLDQSQQVTHQVRTDRWGRQYICDNGRPVYLDQSGFEAQPADYNMNQAQTGDETRDYAPARPAEAGAAAESSVVAESEAELQSRGVPTDSNSNPGNADAAGNAPESPREINNNPDPAGGSGTDTGAAKVQAPQ